jgi:hypothetical protein
VIKPMLHGGSAASLSEISCDGSLENEAFIGAGGVPVSLFRNGLVGFGSRHYSASTGAGATKGFSNADSTTETTTLAASAHNAM